MHCSIFSEYQHRSFVEKPMFLLLELSKQFLAAKSTPSDCSWTPVTITSVLQALRCRLRAPWMTADKHELFFFQAFPQAMDPGHRLVSVQLTEAIEALDPQHECSEYWDGKADREAAAAGLAPADMGPRPPRPSAGGAPRPKRSRRARCVL